MVGQAIEHGGGHLGVAKHLGPIGKGEIGGDQQRGIFVELADQVEQQLAAGLAERQIAQFVDDDEIVAQQVLGQATAAAGGLFLVELVDQIDQVEEAAPGPGADDRRGDANGEVGLAGAGRDRDMLPDTRGRMRRSTTPFILAVAAESRLYGAIGSAVSPCWWLNSPTGRWRWCRNG